MFSYVSPDRIGRILEESGGISPAYYHFNHFLMECKNLFARHDFRQPRCFISYCWGSNSDLREQLQKDLIKLKTELEMLGATVLLDLSNLSSNINQFMDEIEGCDFVFLIGTPELKMRLQEQAQNNIKLEFSHIERKLSSKPDCLLPLIFQAEGNFSSAFEQTMPIRFIKQHNILVRDCRRFGDEWTNPESLSTYIGTLSGFGAEPKEPLGVIASIYGMANRELRFRDEYKLLRENLKYRLIRTNFAYKKLHKQASSTIGSSYKPFVKCTIWGISIIGLSAMILSQSKDINNYNQFHTSRGMLF